MKDKLSVRLISLGFLSGIIFSGLIFLTINVITSYQRQMSLTPVQTITTVEETNDDPLSSNKKVDLNKASLIELDNLPGIGQTKAAAIIDFREKYGPFESISELAYVSGIGNNLINSIQDLVIINK